MTSKFIFGVFQLFNLILQGFDEILLALSSLIRQKGTQSLVSEMLQLLSHRVILLFISDFITLNDFFDDFLPFFHVNRLCVIRNLLPMSVLFSCFSLLVHMLMCLVQAMVLVVAFVKVRFELLVFFLYYRKSLSFQ